MNLSLKKIIKFATYSTLIFVGSLLAIIPFLKKTKEFSSDYSPVVREASADIPYVWTGDDDDDDGSI